MSRVQFVETVTAPSGINGALMPLAGVGATPYVVDVNGVEGGQANAYAGRTGATAASSMVTDASGTVSYWLDAGDYNVHFQDQQSPPRVADYVRGFTAPIIDTNEIVVASQNLIQFTGDTKFSMQTADHGLKSDGSFEWLLIVPDTDGGGRQIDGTIYAALRSVLGSPPLTSGKYRLPNVSGRTLIAAGAAATAGGITTTVRHLFDLFGTEAETLDSTKVPNHGHTLHAAGTGITIDGSGTGIGINLGVTGISINAANAVANASYWAPIAASGGSIFSAGSGGSGASAWAASAGTIGGGSGTAGWTASQLGHSHTITEPNSAQGHSHGVSDPTHNHPLHDPTHNHTLDATTGGGNPHNNVPPAAALNLFVKT